MAPEGVLLGGGEEREWLEEGVVDRVRLRQGPLPAGLEHRHDLGPGFGGSGPASVRVLRGAPGARGKDGDDGGDRGSGDRFHQSSSPFELRYGIDDAPWGIRSGARMSGAAEAVHGNVVRYRPYP